MYNIVGGIDAYMPYDELDGSVRDAKLGQVPYAGEFSFRHAPAALRLTENSRIKDGEETRTVKAKLSRMAN